MVGKGVDLGLGSLKRGRIYPRSYPDVSPTSRRASERRESMGKIINEQIYIPLKARSLILRV